MKNHNGCVTHCTGKGPREVSVDVGGNVGKILMQGIFIPTVSTACHVAQFSASDQTENKVPVFGMILF